MTGKKIGLYDSGVGGITVLNELISHFPNEEFIYIGDSKRAPFGDKTEDELWKINTEIITFLMTQNLKCLVLACNTSCALFTEKIRQMLDIPVISLIEATAQSISIMNAKNVVILATNATAKSNAYSHNIKEKNTHINVIEIGCPKLVPIIESHSQHHDINKAIILSDLHKALSYYPDIIVHGCSHYPHLNDIWQAYLPVNTTLFNPATGVVEEMKKINIVMNQNETGYTQFYVSGDIDKFTSFLTDFNQPYNVELCEFEERTRPVLEA